MPRHAHSLPQGGSNWQTAQGRSYLLYTFSNSPCFNLCLFYAEWILIKSSNTPAPVDQSEASLWFNPTAHAHTRSSSSSSLFLRFGHLAPNWLNLRVVGGPSLSVSARQCRWKDADVAEVAARVLAVHSDELDGLGWGGRLRRARGVQIFAAACTTNRRQTANELGSRILRTHVSSVNSAVGQKLVVLLSWPRGNCLVCSVKSISSSCFF